MHYLFGYYVLLSGFAGLDFLPLSENGLGLIIQNNT